MPSLPALDTPQASPPPSHDVVIVGAGSAGLAAALIFGRARRRAVVLDGGPPRNAPASAAYGLFTRDATPPLDLIAYGRADLARYPSVSVREGRAVEVTGEDGAFSVGISTGEALRTRAVLLAAGVVDQLPAVPGVAELWGGDLFHCPFCHGWEVRDRDLAVWKNGPEAVEAVVMLRGWSDSVTVLTDGPSTIGPEGTATLRALGVPVVEAPVASFDHVAGSLEAVRFADGARLALGGVLFNPPQRERSGLAERLGCETTALGHVAVDEVGHTSVPGVFAAGDLVSPSQAVLLAAARGATCAYALCHALAQRAARAQRLE